MFGHRRRPVGIPAARRPIQIPEDWDAPELPPLPDEVAIEVVRYAQYRLAQWVEEQEREQA